MYITLRNFYSSHHYVKFKMARASHERESVMRVRERSRVYALRMSLNQSVNSVIWQSAFVCFVHIVRFFCVSCAFL